MGQKSHPISVRLKINRNWDSAWYSDKKYGENLVEDIKIRNHIKKKIYKTSNYNKLEISNITIHRFPNSISIYIYTSRPGLLIGKKGADIENLKREVHKLIGYKSNINLNISEIKKIDLDAKVLSQVIGKMIVGRKPYKKAVKHAFSRAMAAGAKGIKVVVAGRLAGSDMARREVFREGSIPLHTFDAMVDFGQYDALTTYGIIGVSVWLYIGDKSKKELKVEQAQKLMLESRK